MVGREGERRRKYGMGGRKEGVMNGVGDGREDNGMLCREVCREGGKVREGEEGGEGGREALKWAAGDTC